MCRGGEQNAEAAAAAAAAAAEGSAVPRKFKWSEIKTHRSPSDAWMVYRGRVYDVSDWYDHPGGSVVFTHAGDDFTDVFAAFHPPSAYSQLERFYIGVVDESECETNKQQVDFEKAYRDLRAKLMAMGLFNASLSYYAWKCFSNLVFLSLSFACVFCSSSFWVHMLGACLLAVFWQQCGWLAHDFLHHQVFKNRCYGDMMGIVVGNVCQGFSCAWWKNKHNTHHAVPNLHESSPDAHDGDPDIDTMPILAWSLTMAERAQESSVGKWMIQYQALLYFPVLLFARLSWLHQSFVFAFDLSGKWSTKGAVEDRKRMKYERIEQLGLVLYYVYNGVLLLQMPLLEAVLFFAFAQTLCGLLLAIVFGVGHNGMQTYEADKRPDFWKLQVTTTRNVTSSPFIDWFCGGLQYQVDHHLFPSLPRHNLKRAHDLVASFCKEHRVSYHEADLLTGTCEVLAHLHKVSKQFVEHFPAM